MQTGSGENSFAAAGLVSAIKQRQEKTASARLKSNLSKMGLAALRKRALAVGLSEAQIDEVEDSIAGENLLQRKAALIDQIVKASPLTVHPFSASEEQLRERLEPLKLSELRRQVRCQALR